MTTARFLFRSVMLAGLLAAVALAVRPAPGDAAAEEKPVLYELRTYTTSPGRLPALHKRFADHTMRLFEKHGMRNVIYWTPTDLEDTLVYVIAHESKDAADKSWAGFRSDPEWKKAYAASREDGPIVTKVVSQYLTPTEYSPQLTLPKSN